MLQHSSIKTPLGALTVISREETLLTAGFSSMSTLLKKVVRLEGESTPKTVRKIPGVTDLILD